MSQDIFFNALQLIGGVLLTIGYIPQIIKTIKSKDVSSFSMSYMMLISSGVFLMQMYVINLVLITGYGVAFLITNSLSLMCSLIMLRLTFMYKNNIKV